MKRVERPSPPDPSRRGRVSSSTAPCPLLLDETRGLDHRDYVPLKEMIPDADVPVVRMSLSTLAPAIDPQGLF